MADYESSTQLSSWFIPSIDQYKERAKKSQKNLAAHVDKYTQKKQGPDGQTVAEKPIYTLIPYKYQQEVLSFCVGQMFQKYGREKLRLASKVIVRQWFPNCIFRALASHISEGFSWTRTYSSSTQSR